MSDRVYAVDDENVSVGALLRVYETKIGRLGVVIEEDLKFPDVAKTLCDCGADLIVCIYSTLNDFLPILLARASAFFNGTPVLFCADGYAMYANTDGEMEFASPQLPCFLNVAITKQYHLIQKRKKGKLGE